MNPITWLTLQNMITVLNELHNMTAESEEPTDDNQLNDPDIIDSTFEEVKEDGSSDRDSQQDRGDVIQVSRTV